jgi:hypothetical protein
MATYRIHFYYSESGRLRSKRRDVRANSFTDAVEKLERQMGSKVVVLKIEKL